MTSGPPDLPGHTYIRSLGQGGYSDVYLYQQAMPSRQVAVKVLRITGLTAELSREFTAEANAMAGLAGHPSIAKVFSAAIAPDGRPYLTMMFYPDDSLAQRVSRERLTVGEVLSIGIKIGSAVHTAHQSGLLHRDIKPANILSDEFGSPMLTDFGIAGELAADPDEDVGVSIPYAPPEVLYSRAAPSVGSDVYSLAATLWTLLVGRSPFSVPGQDADVEHMNRINRLPAPRTGRSDVPDTLDALLMQAMAKQPAARPATVLNFIRSLQQVQQELRMPVTEIVVARDAPAAVPPQPTIQTGYPRSTADGTVARRPVSFDLGAAQSPASAQGAQPGSGTSGPGLIAYVPSSQSTPSPSVASPPGQSALTAPATELRPRSVEAHPESVPVPAQRHGVPKAALIAAVAILAMAAGGIAIALSHGSDAPSKDASGPTVSVPADQNAGGAAQPLGPVTIIGQRSDAATVHFAWTYSGSLETDTYRWQTPDGTMSGAVKDPSVDVAASPTGTICVEVKVSRLDGSNASVAWSTPGCVS
jgi:serine/threonine protein kinase